MGAQISSNSWGDTRRPRRFSRDFDRENDQILLPTCLVGYTGPGYIAQSIKDAIDYYNAKNGIVVFAAGNQNSASDYYPAYYDGTIAVAAVTDAGVRASFSNYGDWIEISAPGVSVYSTQLGTAYGYASGTSMACPHVAGVLALGLSVAPDATKDELLACMYETAKDVDGSNGAYAGKLGAGLVDAEAFVACVGEGADPRPTPQPTPPPSVEPEEPPPKPENLKVKMHRKAGDQALASWSHAATASGDGRKFVVEYQTNHDETWTRVDKGRSYVREVDGRFYQPIHAPCLTKGRVRVTAVDHGDSAAAYSDIFKMKCRE